MGRYKQSCYAFWYFFFNFQDAVTQHTHQGMNSLGMKDSGKARESGKSWKKEFGGAGVYWVNNNSVYSSVQRTKTMEMTA